MKILDKVFSILWWPLRDLGGVLARRSCGDPREIVKEALRDLVEALVKRS